MTVAVNEFILFTLVLVRVTGIMLFAPLFGSSNIPPQVKIGLSVLLSFVVFPMLSVASFSVPTTLASYLLAALGELAVGVVIGFASSLIFTGFQMAGHYVGQQMGTALANVLNPQLGDTVSVVGEFYFFFALIIFILMNGHHFLLSALVSSFGMVPVAGVQFPPAVPAKLSAMFGDIFSIGLRIAAPAVVALFLSSVALGFVARTVPQMNLLIIGFPLRIGLGLALVIVSLPLMAGVCRNLFEDLERSIYTLIYFMRG